MDTRELFAKHSLRCTRQRMAVYEALVSCEGHPTAEELFRIVKPRTERLSRATVYNTLEALASVWLVRRMPTTDGGSRYDADTTSHLHLCLGDGAEIVNVPSELSRRLLESLPGDTLGRIGDALGVRITGLFIQLHGVPAPEAEEPGAARGPGGVGAVGALKLGPNASDTAGGGSRLLPTRRSPK